MGVKRKDKDMGAIKEFITDCNHKIQRSIGTREELALRMQICRHIAEHGSTLDKRRAELRLKKYERQMRALGAK